MQQSIINTASALIATVVSIACDNAFVTGGVLSLPFFLIGGFATLFFTTQAALTYCVCSRKPKKKRKDH